MSNLVLASTSCVDERSSTSSRWGVKKDPSRSHRSITPQTPTPSGPVHLPERKALHARRRGEHARRTEPQRSPPPDRRRRRSMEATGDRARRAGDDGGDLAARYYYFNADHVQPKLLRAAEEDDDEQAKKKEYMDAMCVPLMVPAASFLGVLFVLITGARSWMSSSAQLTGEQRVRAAIFHLCSAFAVAQAVAVLLLLCRYLWTGAHAGRTLAAVRVMLVATTVSMVTSLYLGIDADWRMGAAGFLVFAAFTSVNVLYIFGKPEKGVWGRMLHACSDV